MGERAIAENRQEGIGRDGLAHRISEQANHSIKTPLEAGVHCGITESQGQAAYELGDFLISPTANGIDAKDLHVKLLSDI